MRRASWTETWQSVALAVAQRSRCQKRQVGAVVVSADNRDHWVGYNGPPAGLWPPQELRDRDCGSFCPQGSRIALVGSGEPETRCVALHAEQNARNAVSDPSRLEGGLFVVTAAPCWKCALTVASTGVAALVCPPYEPERAELGLAAAALFAEAGILHVKW